MSWRIYGLHTVVPKLCRAETSHRELFLVRNRCTAKFCGRVGLHAAYLRIVQSKQNCD